MSDKKSLAEVMGEYFYKTPHARRLHAQGASYAMCDWADTYPSMHAAWAECKRGDHMLWLAGKFAGPPMSDSRRPLALATVRCARLVEHLGTDALRAANDLTERFGLGEDITEEELKGVSIGAYSADDHAANAANFAAYAIYGHYPICADSTVYEVVIGGQNFAIPRSEEEMRSKCVDIVREVYPEPPGDWDE